MNTKMNNRGHANAVVALLLLVVAVFACKLGDEKDKANVLVKEANAALDDAKKSITEAEEKKAKMLAAIPEMKGEADLEKVKAIAREAIAAYGKAADKCKEAAQKSDEAGKLKVNDKFKEYMALKAKEYNKRAELVEAMKGIPQALIDAQGHSSFDTALIAAKKKVDQLSKEADDLGAQGTKMEQDNPDMIKKS